MIKKTSWHNKGIDKVAELLKVSLQGLPTANAEARLSQYGANEIAEGKKKSPWKLLAHQFTDVMILVLLAAAVVAGFIGDLEDTLVILLIVLLNATVGFVQEYRAEKAMEALKKMVSANATVIRDGNVQNISSTKLVPGDVVLLETGNVVPADIRLIEVFQLKIEEASLTGESHPVEKNTAVLTEDNLSIGDRTNMAYKSTYVTFGRAKGIVVGTGMDTELGKIAEMLKEPEVKTPLQKRLSTFSKKLAFIVVLISVAIFVIGIVNGEAILLMLLTAISLAVAAIPEALPAVITIALALGARRMVREKALIRNLPAVETLGSVTYICSDKTGTLTVNKMSVHEIYVGEKNILALDIQSQLTDDKIKMLLTGMALNNDACVNENGKVIGDPTEIAFCNLANANQFMKNELEKKFPRIAELPFDSDRKCMTTIHKTDKGYICFTKGALDMLLDKADEQGRHESALWMGAGDKMAADGLRVLGFAKKEFETLPERMTHEFIEAELIMLGIGGLIDPPRSEARLAVHECKAAGIKPVMITGDYALTAKTIATQLGIVQSENDLIVTGNELAAMPFHEFKDKVEHIKVYARVSPEQKLSIIKALQEKGQYVAMTGDGVNDSPSLKRADIGIAMGITGTDVSKEAADMILLDDNFATIVKSVKQGRRIFDNMRKFIKYAMTGNIAEILTIFLAPFFGLPIPLLPIHILWINLVTDGLPGLALASEPSERGIMSRPPRHPNESIFANGLGIHIIWVGILMGAVAIATQAWSINSGNSNWQTMVFTVLCFSQMGHVFAIRSDTQSLFLQGIFSNLPLLGAIVLTLILQLAIIYVPFFNKIFNTSPLSMSELLITIALSSIVFVMVEIEKVIKTIRKRKFEKQV